MHRCVIVGLLFLVTAAFAAGPTTVPVEGQKTYIHAASGFEFPKQVETFDRANVYRYDENGSDVSVAYNDTIVGILTTVYVYPDPDIGLDAHFAQIRSQIEQVHPQFKLLAAEPWTLRQQEREVVGHKAVYTYTDAFLGKKQPIISEAYLIKVKGNFVAYRVSFPNSRKQGVDALVQRFLEKLALPAS